jgi:hypothetical protein
MCNIEPFLKDGLSDEERARREGFVDAIESAIKKYGFGFSDSIDCVSIFDLFEQEASIGKGYEPTDWTFLI